jgi:hypothetical protein
LDPTLSAAALPSQTQIQGQAQTSSGASAPTSGTSSGFTFHDLLSIINPLQHIPVIGTLYRAITGDTIGVPEKIAGDALYGGLWGAVSSLADAAFQAATGKDFGDTVLALFTGSHGSDTQVASNAPNTAAISTQASADIAALNLPSSSSTVSSSAIVAGGSLLPVNGTSSPDANLQALSASLAQKGVDSTLAQRALYAYQRSMALPASMLVPAQ